MLDSRDQAGDARPGGARLSGVPSGNARPEDTSPEDALPGGAPSLRARRVGVACALAAAAVLIGVACWRWLPGVYAWLADPEAVRALVREHGLLARLVMVGVNALQIVLAFLPGEPVELAAGYAFGFWEGTALCLVASALASGLIFVAVRRWGWRLVGVFFDRSHLERFSWLSDARRLELLMLVVFLIPGTPKDFLTYFAGLTRARLGAVLAIATFGRIPSVVTSTMAASALGDGNWPLAVGTTLAAVALAGAGALAYRRLEGRLRG